MERGSIGAGRHRYLSWASVSRCAAATAPLLLVAALLAGCGGEERGARAPTPAPTERAAAPATPTAPPQAGLEAARAAVPQGWTLGDWAVSQDGAYLVLLTTPPPGAPDVAVLGVYRTDEGALSEVARLGAWAGDPTRPPQDLRIEDAGGVLAPDASGLRRLTAGSMSVTIDASGNVNVQDQSDPSRQGRAAPATDPLALIDVTPSSYQATPLPALSVPAGVIPAGWTVAQAAWSPDGERVAVVTASGLSFMGQLSLYSLEGGGLRELWRAVNAFLSLDEELAFKDVNGDGSPDLVYTTSSGGNAWTGSPTLAVSLPGGDAVREITFRLPIEQSAPGQPRDLDGDGVYEWMAVDASWELQGFCHACSPASYFVLAWNGREYVDATERYAEAVDLYQGGGSPRADPVPPAGGAACREHDEYLAAAVSRFLDYWDSARRDDASRILAELSAYAPPPGLVAKRDWIAGTLAADPHAVEAPLEPDFMSACPFD